MRLRRARGGARRDGVRRVRGRARRLPGDPAGDDPPVDAPGVGGRRAAAGLLHRGQLAHQPAQALPQQVRPAARARAVLRARPAGARGDRCSPRTWARRPTSRPRSTSSTGATGPSGIVGTVHTHPYHPLDVVGWDGCLYPYAFNVADFEPITGRVHQPPPVHQVFEGANFVICNFVPRKVDYHPLVDPGALLPLQRRQRRGHVLRRRRLRGAQGLRHRQGLGLAAPRWPRARPAARGRTSARSAWSTSTSSPSWSTPSGRWSSARRGRAVDDGRYAWSWVGGRAEPGA